MKHIMLVGMGGFLGAVGRYLTGGWVHKLIGTTWFPLGTLVVNVLGCLLIGLLGGLAEHRAVLSPEARLFLLIGLLGGFTTFSSFGYESLTLFRDAEIISGLLNIALNVVLALAAVLVGFKLSHAI